MGVDYRAHWHEVADAGPFKNPYRIGWENFLRHVVAGAPMQADFAAGIRDVQFAEACYRSMKDGTWMSLARALVTGTSAGLGRAIAVALAREGYDLALTELDTAMLKDTLAHPAIANRKVVPIALDLRSQASIKAAFERARAELGDIDLLVNNAGRALLKPVVDVTDAEWDDVIDTNLKGAFFLSQLFGRALHRARPAGRDRQHGLDPRHDRHRRPLGLRHLQGRADPDDADAGDRMGRQEHPRQRDRADHRDDGIAPADAERSRGAAAALSRIPTGRFATPEEIAAAVVYLASPGAASVTGHTLPVDGGLTAVEAIRQRVAGPGCEARGADGLRRIVGIDRGIGQAVHQPAHGDKRHQAHQNRGGDTSFRLGSLGSSVRIGHGAPPVRRNNRRTGPDRFPADSSALEAGGRSNPRGYDRHRFAYRRHRRQPPRGAAWRASLEIDRRGRSSSRQWRWPRATVLDPRQPSARSFGKEVLGPDDIGVQLAGSAP